MEKCLQNIGEAAKHLSQQFTDVSPHVPWAEISGLRNVVAHEYGDIDYDRLWAIAVNDVPALVAALSG